MSAAAITVDGDLADWGVDPLTLLPSADIEKTISDQVGSGNFRLQPGWGGQAYDAEALYAKKSGDTLFIALITGHNPRTLNQPTNNSYGVGDFAIDFGRNGSFDAGINIHHAVSGSAGAGYSFESFGVEGGVYITPTWAYGVWDDSGNYTNSNSLSYAPDTSHPTHLIDGEWVGNVSDLYYSVTPVTGLGSNPVDLHYIYEMSVHQSVLFAAGWNGTDSFDIHWTQNCANDSIWVDPPGGTVPEPGTLALLGLGVLGMIFGSRKKKTTA